MIPDICFLKVSIQFLMAEKKHLPDSIDFTVSPTDKQSLPHSNEDKVCPYHPFRPVVSSAELFARSMVRYILVHPSARLPVHRMQTGCGEGKYANASPLRVTANKTTIRPNLITVNCYKLRLYNTTENITPGYNPHEIIIPYDRNTDNIMLCHNLYYIINWGIFRYRDKVF